MIVLTSENVQGHKRVPYLCSSYDCFWTFPKPFENRPCVQCSRWISPYTGLMCLQWYHRFMHLITWRATTGNVKWTTGDAHTDVRGQSAYMSGRSRNALGKPHNYTIKFRLTRMGSSAFMVFNNLITMILNEQDLSVACEVRMSLVRQQNHLSRMGWSWIFDCRNQR